MPQPRIQDQSKITSNYRVAALLPNALSLARVGAGVIIAASPPTLTGTTYLLTVVLVVFAAVSDAADGYLARRWGVSSATGYVLDAMGDRAVHLALLLVYVQRYDINLLVAWLLVFRDVSIYAVRVLSVNWLERSREARWLSVTHATCLRAWLATYIIRDGITMWPRHWPLDMTMISYGQYTLIGGTILLSYVGLFRSFCWTIERQHNDLSKD